jgi:hypothetical protein
MNKTQNPDTILKTFPFRDLSVTLRLKGKESMLEFEDVNHQVYRALIWDGPRQIGLTMHHQTREDEEILELRSASKLFPNYILLSLVSPNISFRMSLDGNGIGIADIRDFRDGGLRKFRFELAKVDLMVALVFDPAFNMPSIAFCWSDENYDPYMVV